MKIPKPSLPTRREKSDAELAQRAALKSYVTRMSGATAVGSAFAYNLVSQGVIFFETASNRTRIDGINSQSTKIYNIVQEVFGQGNDIIQASAASGALVSAIALGLTVAYGRGQYVKYHGKKAKPAEPSHPTITPMSGDVIGGGYTLPSKVTPEDDAANEVAAFSQSSIVPTSVISPAEVAEVAEDQPPTPSSNPFESPQPAPVQTQTIPPATPASSSYGRYDPVSDPNFTWPQNPNRDQDQPLI